MLLEKEWLQRADNHIKGQQEVKEITDIRRKDNDFRC